MSMMSPEVLYFDINSFPRLQLVLSCLRPTEDGGANLQEEEG